MSTRDIGDKVHRIDRHLPLSKWDDIERFAQVRRLLHPIMDMTLPRERLQIAREAV